MQIASDGGRVCRPLIICDRGVPRVRDEHLGALREGRWTFNSFLQHGLLEYLGEPRVGVGAGWAGWGGWVGMMRATTGRAQAGAGQLGGTAWSPAWSLFTHPLLLHPSPRPPQLRPSHQT